MPVTECGTVKSVSPGRARVETLRTEACTHCSAKGACEMLIGESKPHVVEVDDPFGVKPGMTVELVLETKTFLATTFLTYMVPVLALLAGALLGRQFGPQFGFTSTGGSVWGALLLGGAAMYSALRYGRGMAQKKAHRPAIRRIMKPGSFKAAIGEGSCCGNGS